MTIQLSIVGALKFSYGKVQLSGPSDFNLDKIGALDAMAPRHWYPHESLRRRRNGN